MKLNIDLEFKALIPALSAAERGMLEQSIVAEGCRDPLVVWNGTIVDGHNRYEICTKHKIEFGVVKFEFGSRDEVIFWIITNQIGRRNLNPIQAAYFRGTVYEKFRDNVPRKGWNRKKGEKSIPGKSSMAETGKVFGVSDSKIRLDYRLKCAIDKMGDAAKEYFLSGTDRIRNAWLIELAEEGPAECSRIVETLQSGEDSIKDVVCRTRQKHIGEAGRCSGCGSMIYGNQCIACQARGAPRVRRADADAEISSDLDDDATQRLEILRESKASGSQIAFFCSRLLAVLSEEECELTRHEMHELKKVVAKFQTLGRSKQLA